MIAHQKISLIVPCRNEAGVIGNFVRRVPDYVDEIIVVDNNSQDRSSKEAKRAGAIVIKEKRTIDGIGYGFAHQTGIEHATGDIIVAMDSDDTYPVRSIRTIILYMDRYGLDFISCARLPLRYPKAISSVRRFGITVLNGMVRLLYGHPMNDILTGMWIIRRETARHLILREGGWDFSPEIKLAALNDPETSFAEYHIDHFRREHAISKQNIWKTGTGHLWYIAKRRFTVDIPFFAHKAYETT